MDGPYPIGFECTFHSQAFGLIIGRRKLGDGEWLLRVYRSDVGIVTVNRNEVVIRDKPREIDSSKHSIL